MAQPSLVSDRQSGKQAQKHAKFIVPSADAKGKSAPLSVRVPPYVIQQAEELLGAALHFHTLPFRSLSHVFRCALVLGLERIRDEEPRAKDLLAELRFMQPIIYAELVEAAADNAFERLETTIARMLARGRHRRAVQTIRMFLEQVPESETDLGQGLRQRWPDLCREADMLDTHEEGG